MSKVRNQIVAEMHFPNQRWITLKTVVMSILGIDFPTRSVRAAAARAAPAKAALAKAIAHLNLSYVSFFHNIMALNFDILMHILSESACDGFVWW